MSTTDEAKSRFSNPFIALKHKNFRYYWIGMCVSLIGTWMQNIAQPWLAYTLTNSPFLLSLIGILQFTPMLLLALFAGVIVDKASKKKILIFTQSASLVITLILAILVWTGKIQYWHILLMATAMGIVNTIDMPSRQALVIELVGKEDLMNGIALNSMAFNLARIIGPAVAGLVMGYVGLAACFFINSISFAAVLASLYLIKLKPAEIKPQNNSDVWEEIKDGLTYIYHKDSLLYTIIILTIVGTFAPNFNVLVPVFAKEVLHQNEAGFGILMSFLGAGSFLGAMFIATLSKSGPKKFIIYGVPFIIAMALIVTGYIDVYLLTGLSLAVTGFFFIMFTSSANSTLQLNSSNEYRGRVMSVYTLVFAGTTPFGNFYAGLFAEHFNARVGFAACGMIIIVLMLLLYMCVWKKRIF
ncbi:MFS transporter [Propionispora vibrioides]|uniref:Predicted arabinose efflux permease, MFS family n=1 Tax=Propionispora vibrioides TaxID=112903 RepID=A0A1H8Y2H5_9FIRM|nr:MFS transporter [Propionispora vibrioides]SEP46247.1 Predicted arabinose efflux permease, MFS family [Propionispora vibrioides]